MPEPEKHYFADGYLEEFSQPTGARVVVRATSFSYTPGEHKCLRVKRSLPTLEVNS
jgi:hypothetical protein